MNRASGRRLVRRALRLAVCLAALHAGFAASARAQTVAPPGELPGSRPIPMPGLPATPEADPGAEAEVRVAPEDAAPGRAPHIPRLVAREIRIVGNSVLDPALLEAVASRYVDRPLETADLAALQGEINQLYADRGYAMSGAVFPDQDLVDGVLVIAVVEARVVRVDVRGAQGYRPGVLERRIAQSARGVLDVRRLDEGIALLLRDPRIRTAHATLRRAPGLGEWVLEVEVSEAPRLHAELEGNNYQSPAIGAENARLSAGFSNAAGFGDEIDVSMAISKGVQDVLVGYQIPLNAYETQLDLRLRRSASRIVEAEFASLDIESTYTSARVGLIQPLFRSPSTRFEVGLLAEWRRSNSSLDGDPFLTTDPSGGTTVSVLRFHQDLVKQRRNQVFAARSTFSFGLPVLGASTGAAKPGANEVPDFVAWLGQVQALHRFDWMGVELLVRGDVQLAFDPLVPFERFSVGGRYSVRGFRQNELVRDNGYTVGAELRIPLLRRPDGRRVLQAVPFVDHGRSWNHDRGPTPDPKNLTGIGVGLVWQPLSWLAAEAFYGGRVQGPSKPEDADLQDHGFYFGVTASYF